MSGVRLIIQIDEFAVSGAIYGDNTSTVGSVTEVAYKTVAERGRALGDLIAAIEEGVKETDSSIEKIKDKLYLSLGPALLNFRVLDLPFTEKAKVLEVLPIEMSGRLSFDIDEAQLDAVKLGTGRVLAVAVEKTLLNGLLGLFKEVGIDPVWIGSSLFATPVLMGDSAGGSLLIGPDFITATESSTPQFFNSYTSKMSLSASLKYLDSEGIQYDRVLCLGVDPGEITAITDKKIDVEVLSEPAYGGKEGTVGEAPVAVTRSLSALSQQIETGSIADNVDFRHGEFEYSLGRQRIRSKLKLTIGLSLLLLSLIGFDLYLKYTRYSGIVTSVNKSLHASYRELFPETRKGSVIDGLYLLEAKMKAVEEESLTVSGISPLTIMRALTVANAADKGAEEIGVKLYSTSIVPERISAEGTAATFDAANRYKEAVEKIGLGTVRMSEVKSLAGDGVGFSLVILR